MDNRVDQVIKAAVTQTGGIEDIIKTVVGQVTQSIRRENATLKEGLDDANCKIEWLEGLMKHEEQDKVRALQAQRAHYLQIGGPDFRRIIDEQETEKAKVFDEIDFLEAQHLGDRGHGTHHRHDWYNSILSSSQVSQYVRAHGIFPPSPYDPPTTMRTAVAPPLSARARSSTTMESNLQSYAQDASPSPVTRPRSSTTTNPDARSFNPSPDFSAGSKKPPINSLAVAPAPRVYGLRNAHTGRYDSPFFCTKCRTHFAFYSNLADHYKNCKGPDAAVESLPGMHNMPNVPAGLSTSHDLDRHFTRRPRTANSYVTPGSPGHACKSTSTKSVEE
ncbi:hypothetical protein SLS60_010827 [Paraconiothyrium brasiliense]|uniref:C2H2-type domain-containing protein n=1 Tax=Paraconiothyrium brasiliense TaxID=300254 RepID=A0ABR3QMT1_9PLEO